MKSIHTTVIAACLLSSLTGLAQAQTPSDASRKPMDAESITRAHTNRTEHHARRLSDLKGKLKLEAQQETAWNEFVQSMQVPAQHTGRADRIAMEKLSTPERLDQMQARKVARDAEMQKHAEATRTFYAALNPVQKKVFDDETARRMHRQAGGMGHGADHHGHH